MSCEESGVIRSRATMEIRYPVRELQITLHLSRLMRTLRLVVVHGMSTVRDGIILPVITFFYFSATKVHH